ncbi:MAG: hypothetical protein AB1465_05420 [Patescibacteria group bacterium]
MKIFILRWQAILKIYFGFLVVLALSAILAFGGNIYKGDLVGRFSCIQTGWERKGSSIAMKANCGGHEVKVVNRDFVVSYLNEPAPFFCNFYEREIVDECSKDREEKAD